MRAVLDAQALVAFFRAEPAAEEVALRLRAGGVVSAVNLVEVVDQLVRVTGAALDDVQAALMHLVVDDALTVQEVSAELGLHAGRLRAAHYSRQHCPVSLADCVAAATASSLALPLATADAHLARVVVREGGRLVPLPNSRGQRPGE